MVCTWFNLFGLMWWIKRSPAYRSTWPFDRFEWPHREKVRSLLKLGLPMDRAAEERLMNQYRHLSAYPENREVLQALADRGIRAGILSNGDPEMLAVAIKSAGFQDLVNPVLSAHAVQRFKTDAAVYQLGPDALQLPAKRILFVSSNGWDAIGATWFGFTTLWVNRAGGPIEQLDIQPTRIGSSLRDVLDFFPASA